MATIKSYTDLEQSKKLAEILLIESADMHYNNGSCRGVDYTEHFSAELMPYQDALHLIKIHKTNFMFQVIPCWSLAALLSILPKYEIYNNGETIQLDVNLEALGTEGNETLLDLVVNMIIHLHERKML